jgi:hypothetical protein
VQNTKVQKLIAARETARKIISPASDLLSSERVTAPLAQISFLSSRQEHWDRAVCAVGFAHERSLSAGEVLIKAAEDVKAQVTGTQTRAFLDYCNNISSISEENLSVAAGVIVAGIGHMSVDTKLLIDFETCFELCGDDDNCLTACLAKKL